MSCWALDTRAGAILPLAECSTMPYLIQLSEVTLDVAGRKMLREDVGWGCCSQLADGDLTVSTG